MESGVPLVLLHPFPVDASFWDPMQEHLRHRPVLRPEAPGFGAASPQPAWTISGFADHVADRIRAATPAGTGVVMGLSMGGYVALELAVRHPDVLAGLVLADTRAGADDTVAAEGRNAAIRTVEQDGLDAFLEGFLPRALAPDAPDDVRRTLAAIARAQTPGAVADALGALRDRRDTRPLLGGIACPTLVLVGAHDQLTPVAMSEELAEGIPSASLVVVDGVGHMSALEAPAAVAGHVDAFCRGLVD